MWMGTLWKNYGILRLSSFSVFMKKAFLSFTTVLILVAIALGLGAVWAVNSLKIVPHTVTYEVFSPQGNSHFDQTEMVTIKKYIQEKVKQRERDRMYSTVR